MWAPSRRQLAAVAILATSCSKTRPVAKPKPTVEQQIAAAAEFALECMSSAGPDCLSIGRVSDAWSAHGDLELIVEAPPAVLAKQLLKAADEAQDGHHVGQRVTREAERVALLTRDLSCRAAEVHRVGKVFAARRKLIAERAQWLGLHRTVAGPAVIALLEAAEPLDEVRLVIAHCSAGKAYLLVTPPTRELEPDDDPAAYAGGGWEVVVAGTDSDRLLRGYLRASRAKPVMVVDRPSPDFVDPWIPASEVEL